MSLNSALLAGTSGLIANSGALAAISDNIANVNTVGYKRSITSFDPLVKASSNSISYNAGGVQARARQLVSQQGLLASSASATDIGISGPGFFVVKTQPQSLGATDAYLFTRSGSFIPDDNGFLYNTAGYYLQGWPVQSDGSVQANPSDLTSLETVNIGAIGGTAEPTTRVQYNANLQSSTEAGTNGRLTGYAPGAMADFLSNGAGVAEPDFQTTVQVFDSLGTLRTFTFAFMKQDPAVTAANRWHFEVVATPASDVSPAADDGLLLSGEIVFNSNGEIDLAASTFANADGSAASLSLSGLPQISLGAFDAAAGTRWSGATGSAAQVIDLDFGGPSSTGGLTQLDSPSLVLSTTVNGSVFGDLSGVEIDPNGFVIAKFNNGIVKRVYQVPVATFVNANGLQPENGGSYRITAESGTFTMKRPGAGGAGLISPKSLEASNVDLATEFTGLITTQRAYSAASKIITTADEMLDELIRMKR